MYWYTTAHLPKNSLATPGVRGDRRLALGLAAMAVEANDPRTKQQQIADDLITAIASGTLRPGDALPSARALMKQYSVSNQTVQNAFKALKAQNLIDGRPGRGTFVHADVDPAALGTGTMGKSSEFIEIMSRLGRVEDEVRGLKHRLLQIENERQDEQAGEGDS